MTSDPQGEEGVRLQECIAVLVHPCYPSLLLVAALYLNRGVNTVLANAMFG